MKRLWVAVLSMLVIVGLSVGSAEAKRLGGGSSFGSKSSHSQPQKMDAVPDAKNQGAAQATPPSSSAAAPAAAAPRRGMGGMLGGLMMGGLLGALFFGGAFENINFMDILVFVVLGLVAFMLFRHFVSRRAAPQYAASGAYGAPAPATMDATVKHENVYQRNAASMPLSSSFARPKLVYPAGFNEKEFLDGAKRAHELLQKAWDDGELAELRGLTTDKVFGEIQDQYRARAGENRTEISDVRAELLDVKEIDGKLEASVLFDCSMAEYDANSPVLVNSERVREVWHFERSKSSLRPTWLLDGIQQVME